MNSDSLKYVLREFVGRPLPESKPRDLSLPTDSGKVIGLSGVRRCGRTFLFFDTENVSVFVTGSSSRHLTRDLSSALRGRSITYEVFPLGFRELLAFRGLSPEPWDATGESLARAAFEDYLRWGGFPEIVLAEPALRPLILEEYASLMLHRDLPERSAVRNEPLLRTLLRLCFRNTALSSA